MNENIRGLIDEQIVIGILKDEGYEVNKASKADNLNGVDFYLDSVPVDAKSQRYHPMNSLCFELQVLSSRSNSWEDGWFVSGHAEVYAYLTDNSFGNFTLYLVNKQLLKVHLEDVGFDYINYSLRRETIARQIRDGRTHINAVNGFMFIDNLTKLGIITKVIEVKEGYVLSNRAKLQPYKATQTNKKVPTRPVIHNRQ